MYGESGPGEMESGGRFAPPPPPPPQAGPWTPAAWGDRPRRHRFSAATLVAALVVGGGAGAATAAAVSGGGGSSDVPAYTSAAATPTAQGSTLSGAAGLVAKVEPALVDIHTEGSSRVTSPLFGNGINPFGGPQQATISAAGTGMILGSDGLVLTNAHVIAGATSITVTYDGQTSSHKATLVGEDAAKDVALIRIQGAKGLPTVTLGSSSGVRPGDPVLAIGNALNLQVGGFTVSNGIISGTGRQIQTDNGENLSGLLQTSAAISSGDSGGPLVDSAGQVIGMNTAAATGSSTNTASNIGFAIPVDEIKSLIPQLEKGNIGTPTIGQGPSNGSGYGGSNPYGSGGGYGYPFFGGGGSSY